MAELPKVQAANVQRAALADVPSLRFEDLAVTARAGGNIGDALDRMSQSLLKAQEEDVRRKAAEYAIERPLTPEQWRDIRRDPKELDKYFKGQGKVFKETYMAAQASQLSSELTVRLENQFDLLKKKLELGEITEQQAVATVRDAIDGATPVVASMSPEVGLKFKANVAMRGSSVYEKAVQMTARRTKATDEIVLKQYTDNIPTQIDARIANLIGSGIPVDMRDVEALVLQEPARFAAKHGDENTFFAPAKKAFRAAVTARIKDAVNSPAALDNPQIVQKALQSGEFNIKVNVAGNEVPIDLQAEWNYLNDEEKKSVREEFNAAFNARYNLITKSREIDKLNSSQAVVEVAEGLKSKLLALDANDPGVNEAGISEFLAGKAKEFKSTASAVNSPEITKAASDGLMVVYKQFISDFVQTKMTPDQQKNLVLGQPATGDNSKSINYIFQSADLATRVELQKHLREEITARNSFLASEDRRVEDARKDAVREKIQTIFAKPRNSPEVKVALAELKTLDSLKWTDITKAFAAGRTQDDKRTIDQLQIARANGTLNTDMVLRLGSNLTINSQEQYFGYALTAMDKENQLADEKARNKLKYTKAIADSVNKTASDIEAQNAYIAVSTEYSDRYNKWRSTIGSKDQKPWNAMEEMDKLVAGAVKEKEAKVVQGARARVDSFRDTYLIKGKTYTDDEILRQIQLKTSKQTSDFGKQQFDNKDLNLIIQDIKALKGAK